MRDDTVVVLLLQRPAATSARARIAGSSTTDLSISSTPSTPTLSEVKAQVTPRDARVLCRAASLDLETFTRLERQDCRITCCFIVPFFTLASHVCRHLERALAVSARQQNPGVVEWKFRELDKNHDGLLRGMEVKSLNRIVRKRVKPLKCAKRFPNYCDENKDKEITEAEWSACLGDYVSKMAAIFADDFFCSKDQAVLLM